MTADPSVLEVVVDSRIRLRGHVPEDVLDDLVSKFEHRNPQARERPEEPAVFVTWRRENGEHTFPRGGLDRVKEALEGVPHRWTDRRVGGEEFEEPLVHRKTLWEHQERLLAAVVEHETALVRASTGGGKTTVGLALFAKLGVPAIVLVHTQALQDLWVSRAVEELGIMPEEIGRIGDGVRELRPLTIALHQSLARPGAITDEMTGYFGVLIGDECFVPGTMILMEDGSQKAIENVGMGDRVAGGGAVISTMARPYEGELVRLNGVWCTPEHPVATQRGWLSASAVDSSDVVWEWVRDEKGAGVSCVRRADASGDFSCGVQKARAVRELFCRWGLYEVWEGGSSADEGLSLNDVLRDAAGVELREDGEGGSSVGFSLQGIQAPRVVGEDAGGVVEARAQRTSSERMFGRAVEKVSTAGRVGGVAETLVELDRRGKDQGVRGARAWQGCCADRVRGSVANAPRADGVCAGAQSSDWSAGPDAGVLSDRFRSSGIDVGGGDRWGESWSPATARGRCKEGCVFETAGLGSAPIPAPSKEGIRLRRRRAEVHRCPASYAGAVHNLETENHVYIAGGVLVHNCHKAAARTMYEVIDPFPARHRVLFSADETRKDGREFFTYDLAGPPRMEISRAECVAAGKVLDVEVLVVPTDFDARWYLAGMRRKERYPREKMFLNKKLIDATCADPARNELVMAAVLAGISEGDQAIVLSKRVEHCNAIDRELVARAIPSGFFLGGKQNQKMFRLTTEGMKTGAIRVGVGTIDALGTGIDLPSVSVGVVATPTASNKQLSGQVSGRICRTTAGKTRARLYYLWDRRVNPSHLENLAKWNPTVRLLTPDGWVDANKALADLDSIDFDPSGIIERLRGDPGRPGQMRSRTQQRPAEETAGDMFNKPQEGFDDADKTHPSIDASALHIALKSKGASPGLVVVKDWSEAQKTSASAWAHGRLEERPAHVPNPEPPPSSTAPLENDFALLAQRLLLKGIDVKITQLAAWLPEQRSQAARWCESLAEQPAFLLGSWAGPKQSASKLSAPERTLDLPKVDAAKDPQMSAIAGTLIESSFADTVTVVWGEEKYCLSAGSFCTTSVGPFSITLSSKPGETLRQTWGRANDELRSLAVAERDRKIREHREKLVEAGILKAAR